MAHIVGRDDDTKAARVPSMISGVEKAQYAELSRTEMTTSI
jgi:hypothetical protein